MRNQIFKLMILSILTTICLSCSSDSDSEGCEALTCLNGGSFVDCECECPPGFTGTECSNEITPSMVMITKATVKVFPNINNGELWDLAIPDADSALPDIYITFQDSDLNTIYDSPTFYENVISGEGTFFEFTMEPPLEVTEFDDPYLVNIYDYDPSNDDDFMTSRAFFAYSQNNGFPETITVVSQSDEILIDLEVSYQW